KFFHVSVPSSTISKEVKGMTRYSLFIATFVFLLLLSTHGVVFIPAWSYRGLDLQKLHVFDHQCPGWPIPYDHTGAACGDPLGRPLLYPPLIYWVMAWTRFFSFYAAEILWSIAIPLLTLLSTFLVDRADSVQAKAKDWAIWFLAFFQMPMVYAVERGNNDAAVLPIYALGVFLIARKRWAWAGIAMAAACWMKVY